MPLTLADMESYAAQDCSFPGMVRYDILDQLAPGDPRRARYWMSVHHDRPPKR